MDVTSTNKDSDGERLVLGEKEVRVAAMVGALAQFDAVIQKLDEERARALRPIVLLIDEMRHMADLSAAAYTIWQDHPLTIERVTRVAALAMLILEKEAKLKEAGRHGASTQGA